MEFIALLITSLIAPAILLLMQKKIKETHHQVTVNHHSSENPTLLDLLSDLRKRFDDHLEWHAQNQDKE